MRGNSLASASAATLSQRQTNISRVSLFEFQEPLNASNLTSIAYALSALGFPITVDEVFYLSKTPVQHVTDLGVCTYLPACDLPTWTCIFLLVCVCLENGPAHAFAPQGM